MNEFERSVSNLPSLVPRPLPSSIPLLGTSRCVLHRYLHLKTAKETALPPNPVRDASASVKLTPSEFRICKDAVRDGPVKEGERNVNESQVPVVLYRVFSDVFACYI